MKNKKQKIYKALQGTISITSKGTGYVKVPDYEQDPEIDFKDLNTALHGDIVEIILNKKGYRRLTGRVSRIISRAKIGFVGVLEEVSPPSGGLTSSKFFLKPDDTKMYTDILIPE